MSPNNFMWGAPSLITPKRSQRTRSGNLKPKCMRNSWWKVPVLLTNLLLSRSRFLIFRKWIAPKGPVSLCRTLSGAPPRLQLNNRKTEHFFRCQITWNQTTKAEIKMILPKRIILLTPFKLLMKMKQSLSKLVIYSTAMITARNSLKWCKQGTKTSLGRPCTKRSWWQSRTQRAKTSWPQAMATTIGRI